MYSTVKTAVLSGIEAIPVCVEVDISTPACLFLIWLEILRLR